MLDCLHPVRAASDKSGKWVKGLNQGTSCIKDDARPWLSEQRYLLRIRS